MSPKRRSTKGQGLIGFRGRGFTLVELLVAISIVVVMLFLMNQVFFSTSQAVGQGVGLSRVMDDSRAMMQQFARDAALMIGPDGKLIDGTPSGSSQGGVLIILQKRVMATVPDRFSGEKRREVRSDQLVFIRTVDGETPLAPATTNSYTNTNSAPFARVWYGHGRRTAPNGSDDDMDPGLGDNVTKTNGHYLGAPLGRNELASQWILCRQALQLFPGTDQNQPGIPPIHYNGGWITCGHDTGASLGELNGYGNSSIPNTLRLNMYMGFSDSAWFAYEGDSRYGGMVGGRASDYPNWTPAAAQYRLWSSLNDPQYVERAVVNYTYGYKQLRVNPKPEYKNPSETSQYDYAAWQVAQMHPYLMARVSDFIVEFAGDYFDNDGPMYLGQADGRIDTDVAASGVDADGTEYRYGGGNIVWYTSPVEGYSNAPGPTNNKFTLKQPISYRMPKSGMLKDVMELNPNGGVLKVGGTDIPHANTAFVFRHDDEAIDRNGNGRLEPEDCRWPYLIRLRWRMHDPTNRLWDPADGEAGKWFEQIIAVPRPR